MTKQIWRVRFRLATAARLSGEVIWWALWPAHRLRCALGGHDWYYAEWERECYRCGLRHRFVDDD